MTLAQRYPYAALAGRFGPDDRDLFASRLLRSRGDISPEGAQALANHLFTRATRRAPR